MNDVLIVRLLSVVPKNDTASLMGRFSRLALPRFLHRLLVGWYVRHYNVDLSECAGGIEDFATLGEFFVRGLVDGARPLDGAEGAVVSPVDGRVYAFGTVSPSGQFEQSPGKPASLTELLGGAIGPYSEGEYAVLYLSPRDYHRVHTPLAGALRRLLYRPGSLWPVFPGATRTVDELFGRNERLVFHFDTSVGSVALVMIGAFGVGRMRTHHAPLVTNTGASSEDLAVEAAVGKGEELGRFEMGSTVILVFEKGSIDWDIAVGAPVLMGQRIATRREPGEE